MLTELVLTNRVAIIQIFEIHARRLHGKPTGPAHTRGKLLVRRLSADTILTTLSHVTRADDVRCVGFRGGGGGGSDRAADGP